MDFPLDTVLTYHRLSKHRTDAYAPAPEALDWDAQPAPFRRFADAPALALPLVAEEALPTGATVAPLNLDSLGILFQLSLAITAWKSYGPDRWAVRANPSSGNLHPVEAYALTCGVEGLADGLWHYRPDDHSLELRAQVTQRQAIAAAPQLAIILTTVPWREAWKYGERAFRYCQLDVGHAQAALACAAACLGWRLHQPALEGAVLARLCGSDREGDFRNGRRQDTEREEAELLLTLSPNLAPDFDAEAWSDALRQARWSGSASAIDLHPLYRWPQMEAVAAATRGTVPATPMPASTTAMEVPFAPALLLQRRSAQRFDPRHTLPREAFLRILAATRPQTESGLHLLLFVHRVDGLAPGVYLLPRGSGGVALAEHLPQTATTALQIPNVGPLWQLVAAEPKKLQVTARSLHCHQDLASTGSFALGMVAEFLPALTAAPSRYRSLLREAGALGQALYLAAEREGVAGCGIGCFFDDPVHRLLALPDERFQSLYHFAVGLPVRDVRIETLPPYPPTRSGP